MERRGLAARPHTTSASIRSNSGPKTRKNPSTIPHCSGGLRKPDACVTHRGHEGGGRLGPCFTEYCSDPPLSDDTSRVSARSGTRAAVATWPCRCVTRCTSSGPLAGSSFGTSAPHAPAMDPRYARGPSRSPRTSTHIFPRYCTDRPSTPSSIVRRRPIRAREAGFDSSTSTALTTTCRSIPVPFSYNRRPTLPAAHSRTSARSGAKSLISSAGRRRRHCAIASRFAVRPLLGPRRSRSARRGGRVREYCDDLVDLWDLHGRRHRRVGPSMPDPLAVRRVDNTNAVTQAGNAGKPQPNNAGFGVGSDHEPLTRGRDHQVGPVRHHRAPARAVDLCPFPAGR